MKEATHKKTNMAWFHLHEVLRVKFIETESVVVVARSQERSLSFTLEFFLLDVGKTLTIPNIMNSEAKMLKIWQEEPVFSSSGFACTIAFLFSSPLYWVTSEELSRRFSKYDVDLLTSPMGRPPCSALTLQEEPVLSFPKEWGTFIYSHPIFAILQCRHMNSW